jgi:hypothetical protein
MPVNKDHQEFHAVGLDDGFVPVPGYPEGFEHKILTGFLDEDNKKGGRTRLLKVTPGTYSTEPFVHDYWEEVWQISGDLTVGNDENGEGGESFAPNTYACRPPGAWHGPFKSEGDCILLESHYYDESGDETE